MRPPKCRSAGCSAAPSVCLLYHSGIFAVFVWQAVRVDVLPSGHVVYQGSSAGLTKGYVNLTGIVLSRTCCAVVFHSHSPLYVCVQVSCTRSTEFTPFNWASISVHINRTSPSSPCVLQSPPFMRVYCVALRFLPPSFSITSPAMVFGGYSHATSPPEQRFAVLQGCVGRRNGSPLTPGDTLGYLQDITCLGTTVFACIGEDLIPCDVWARVMLVIVIPCAGSDNTLARIDVTVDGRIVYRGSAGGSCHSWVSLAGVVIPRRQSIAMLYGCVSAMIVLLL